MHRLEGCDVLCLKAFRALLYFELHRLTFVQRLITLRLNRGKMYEYIFPGLALDEPKALRSIEPLHCSLFLRHCCTSRLNCISPSWSVRWVFLRRDSLLAEKKGSEIVLAAPLNESKG
jgi:hypothetical protein